MTSRKTFVIDTSVLLYDKVSIHSFPNNDLVIPLVVLDELDRFKEKTGILGENARYINRYLDSLRDIGNLNTGIQVENGQTIRVERNKKGKIPPDFNDESGDNKIIGLAIHLKEISKNEVVIITKDINFRVKCDAVGIKAEDYYKDRVIQEKDSIYTGFREISAPTAEVIDSFYSEKSIGTDSLDCDLFENEFVICKSGNSSFLGFHRSGNIEPVQCGLNDLVPVSARNKEQKFALDLLTRDDVPLVTLTGRAGSGKTFLTMMSAMSGIKSGKYERIVITRSLQPVGKDIGFLPGDIGDKLDPWMGSITDNFRHHFKDLTYFELMKKRGEIEISPLAFMRGRTFSNTFLIVDEAQNSTIHELKTLITRVGEGSKIVLLGDIEQIDTPYIDSLSNGLTIIVEKFKNEKLTGHVTLIKGERSELATLASKVI